MIERLKKTFTLETAIDLAKRYHNKQKGRSGEPYFGHLENVMNRLQGEESKMAGILHDIVEDTPMTYEQLLVMGCPESVVSALKLVSHPPLSGEDQYLKMISEIAESKNQIAIDVKWADLTHNSDIRRIKRPKENDFKRVDKYLKAKKILEPFVSEYLRS